MLFLNRSFDKKRLKALLLWFRLNLSEGAALKAVETLQELGFRSATQGAISLGLDDLKTPASKSGRVFQAQVEVALAHHEHHRGNRTPVEVFQHLVDTWHRTSQDLTTEVVQLFHSTERVNPVYMMAFSGARGNISQVRQLVGMRGLMADPRGQIVGFPILSNFREGLTITEYFVSCYGARKGVVDTAIRTADAGYLTRRLADVSHHVVVRMTNCGTHRSIQLRDIKEGQKTILSLGNRLVGRVLAEHVYTSKYVNSANSEITPSMASNIASQHSQISVRSPLTCSLPWGVCQLCYGWGLSEGRRVTLGEAVGIIAAQSIGEPGTQLTLRTFHTGGVFSGELLNEIRAPYAGNVLFLKPLQGLLIRTPHGQIAFLTKVFGKMSFQQIAQRPLASGAKQVPFFGLTSSMLEARRGKEDVKPKALFTAKRLRNSPYGVRTPSEPCEVEEVQKVEYGINKNESIDSVRSLNKSSYSLRKKNIANFSSNFLASDGLLRFQSFASLPKDTGFSDAFYPLRALVDIEDVSSKSSMLEAAGGTGLPKVLYPYGLRGMVDITTFHYLLLAKRYSSGVCTRSKSLICFPYFRGVTKRNKSQMLSYVKQGGRKKMPSSAGRRGSKSPFFLLRTGTSMLEAAEGTGLSKVLRATWGMKNISQALGLTSSMLEARGGIVAKRRAEMQQNDISLNITSSVPSASYTKSIFFLLLPSSKDKLFRVLLNSKYFIRLIGLIHLLSSASPFLLRIPCEASRALGSGELAAYIFDVNKKLMFFKEKRNWANSCSFWSFPTNQKNHAYRSNARKDLWEDVNFFQRTDIFDVKSKKSLGEWAHTYRTSLPVKAPKEVLEVMQEGKKHMFHAALKRKETFYPFRALTSSMLEAGSPIYFEQKTNFTIFTLLRKILRSMSFSFLSLKRYRQVAGIPEEMEGSPNFVTQNKQDHEFVIYPSTVIFVKQKEYVYNNQLLAEFSSSTLESTNNQIEITQQVLSETAGQVWFKEIDYGNRKGPGSGLLGTHFSSQKLGGIWVLAGKPKANTLSFNTYRASLPVKAPPLSKAPKEFPLPKARRGCSASASLEVNKLPIHSFPTITELISQKGKCKARSCMNVSFVTFQFPKKECISFSITSKEPQNCDVNSLKRRKEGIHNLKSHSLLCKVFITPLDDLSPYTSSVLYSFRKLVTLIKGKEQLRANDSKEKQKIAKRSRFLPIQYIFLQKLLFLRKFPKIIAFSELFTRGKSFFKYCKFGIQNSLQQKRITYYKTSVINLHDDFRILNYNYLIGYSQKLPGKTSCISVAVPFSSVVQSYLTQRALGSGGSNSSTTQGSLANSIPHLHLFPKKLAPYHSCLFSIPSRSRALQLLVTNFLLTPLVQRRAFSSKGAASGAKQIKDVKAPFRGKSLMLEAGAWPLALRGVYTSHSLGDINVPVNCSENLPLKGALTSSMLEVAPINCIFQSVTKDHVQHTALKKKKHITKQVCTLKAQSNRYHHCYDTVPIGISKTIDDFRKSVLPKSSIPLLAESDLITFITNYSRFKVLLGPPNPFLPISYHQNPFLPTTYSPTEEKEEGKLLTYLPPYTPTGPWVVEEDAKLETIDISHVSSKSSMLGAEEVQYPTSLTSKFPSFYSHASLSSICSDVSLPKAAPLGVNMKRLVKGTMSTRGLKKATVFPGQFVTYGDNIANNIVTTESGQALYIDSQKTIFRKAQTVLIYSQAIITVLSGEWIKKGTPLMSLTYQKLVTGDIVQGLPKIEQFFEAPVLKDGTFWGDSLQAKLNQFFQEQKEKLPLAEAVRKGFSEIQRILVEGVQRVYISQGVLIADKHLEVIVRQMTCKGRILYSGDTGFLRNELVTIDKIENVNQVTYGQKALYHPQVRGITDASLESESFLSAASFQETTRVLSRDAIIGKTDLMRGLKERVIVGELIQAGTGLANNSVYNLL